MTGDRWIGAEPVAPHTIAEHGDLVRRCIPIVAGVEPSSSLRPQIEHTGISAADRLDIQDLGAPRCRYRCGLLKSDGADSRNMWRKILLDPP
ncbi:MAG TPA: hypothetical protein VNR64_14000 [Vicinamibacterales bacterium]|nr:hypothetical protein [Vicinamibacterales bacterium]